jgi:hypothetical protein
MTRVREGIGPSSTGRSPTLHKATSGRIDKAAGAW